MKIGDLVNFHTSSWIFRSAYGRYVNPGIILTLEYWDGSYKSEVWWGDGKITKEHHSYLRPVRRGIDEDR